MSRYLKLQSPLYFIDTVKFSNGKINLNYNVVGTNAYSKINYFNHNNNIKLAYQNHFISLI